MTARVLLAGASGPTRAGLRLTLERAGFEICATASDASELLAVAPSAGPDGVVVAANLPGGALAAVEQLARRLPAARILVMTEEPDEDELLAAVLAGASGYVGADVPQDRLPQVLRGILRGEAAVPRRLSGRLITELRSRRGHRSALAAHLRADLTDREWEVLELLAAGHPTAEIARRARISQVTARRHISNVVHKLGVPDRRAAVSLLGAPPARRSRS